MDNKKIVEALRRIIDKEVNRQVNEIKESILSEVAGMIRYSEGKVMSKLNEVIEDAPGNSPLPSQNSDFGRAMANIGSMPQYEHKVANNYRAKKKKKVYSKDPALNELLNETAGFSREELYDDLDTDLFEASEFDGEDYNEMWLDGEDAAEVISHHTIQVGNVHKPSDYAVDVDGRAINTNNEAVQDVLDILNNTDFSAKVKAMEKAAESFRDSI